MEENHTTMQRRTGSQDDEMEGSIRSNISAAASSPSQPGTPSSSSSSSEPASTVLDEYDPKRIPLDVFASKSGQGIDWSAASNESLFSIYMGNTSLTRDQIAMMYKSGELPMLDQESSSGAATWQPPLPPSSPLRRNQPINIVHVHVHVPPNNNNNSTNNNVITTAAPPEAVLPPSAHDQAAAAVGNTPPITRRNSTTSSTHSFQFPILQQEQMGRNFNRKVEEAEQQQEHSNKLASLTSKNEHNKRESTHGNENQQTRQEQEQEQEQEQTTNNPKAAAAASWTNCFGWCSCFSCLPCLRKPNIAS